MAGWLKKNTIKPENFLQHFSTSTQDRLKPTENLITGRKQAGNRWFSRSLKIPSYSRGYSSTKGGLRGYIENYTFSLQRDLAIVRGGFFNFALSRVTKETPPKHANLPSDSRQRLLFKIRDSLPVEIVLSPGLFISFAATRGAREKNPLTATH